MKRIEANSEQIQVQVQVQVQHTLCSKATANRGDAVCVETCSNRKDLQSVADELVYQGAGHYSDTGLTFPAYSTAPASVYV
jgi:hypothetical protein